MSQKTVLLIDDDPSVTTLLAARLEASGSIAAHTINDPKQAMSTVRRLNPDLIVCDIDMGETGGGDVAFALRNDPNTAPIPIMFLSSMITPDDMGETSRGSSMVSKKIGVAKIVSSILAKLDSVS